MLRSIAVFFSILKRLLRKLECYGIRGVPYSWFRKYIYERYRKVFVNGILSQTLGVDYGLPQGSIQGPLLFLLYINDTPLVVKRCEIFLFADETNVVCQDISIDVQRDLNAIQNYLMKSKLTLNAQKSALDDFNNKSASRCCLDSKVKL